MAITKVHGRYVYDSRGKCAFEFQNIIHCYSLVSLFHYCANFLCSYVFLGNPTVEVDIHTDKGLHRAIVPSGASTGKFYSFVLN